MGRRSSVPQVPGLSPQELQAIQSNNMTLDQLRGILSGDAQTLGQNQAILRQFSGLVDANGNVNQQAVNDLTQRINQFDQAQQGLSQNALDYLGGAFNQTPYGQQSDQLAQLEAQRYEQALRGELPISAGQRQQEQEAFQRLKEEAGRRGIRIEGNDIFSATSQSTAGNQLLSRLRQDAQVRRDNEVNSAIALGGAQNLNRLGFNLNQQGQMFNQAGSLVQNPANSSMGFLNAASQFAPSQLAGSYLGLGQGYLNGAQPYQNQRMLQYQRDLQNSANRNASRNAIGGLVGGGIGAGVGGLVGGLPGAALGYGFGSGLGGFAATGQPDYGGMGLGFGLAPSLMGAPSSGGKAPPQAPSQNLYGPLSLYQGRPSVYA